MNYVPVFINDIANSVQNDQNKLNKAQELLSQVKGNSEESFQLSFIIEQQEPCKHLSNTRQYT